MTECEDVLRAKVRAAIRNSGTTQATVAHDLGLSQQHLSRMLTGKATLTLTWAEQALTACGARHAICAVNGCGKPPKGRGWCTMHYSRWQRHGGPHWEPPAPVEQCEADGCLSEPKGRRFCHKHYTRWQRHGDLIGKQPRDPAETRFWRRVEKSEGCWEWCPPLSSSGYGVLSANGYRVYAHRFSYEVHFGPIADGLHVCHRCDNPPCVRPDHLFLGTQSDNIQDMWNKGRRSRSDAFRKAVDHGL